MKLFFSPVPHQEALDFLRTRPAVSRAVFDDLTDDLKAISFVVTGIDDATQLQVVKNILSKLPAGTNYEDVKEQIMAVLPFAGKKAERRAELLLRHWGGIAYAAAQWQRMNRQRDVFPWWQYVTMNDPKVRATHVALGGITLRHDDPFWQGHYPPWEPLCRCQVVSLMDDDVDRMREEDKGLPPDQRRVLEGPLLKQLHDSNRLVRGMNQVFDVRTPGQKGEAWIGWDPANLAAGLNIAKTQAGLSPGVFAKLMKFLKAQDLGNGVSVWDWWVARQPGGRPAAVPVAPVPAPVPVAGTRQAIEAAVFTKEKVIGTGINGTLKLTNGEEVLFKPLSKEAPASHYRRDVPDGTQYKREIAASLLHDALGYQILPTTAGITHPAHGEGSAQLWADGAQTAAEYHRSTGMRMDAITAAIPLAIRQQWQLFDDLINHLDRHAGNWMVKPSTTPGQLQLILIDHGLALPNGTADQGWGHNGKRFPGPLEGKTLSKSSQTDLKQLISSEASIRQLLSAWLEPRAIDLVFRRARAIVQRGTYGSVIL